MKFPTLRFLAAVSMAIGVFQMPLSGAAAEQKANADIGVDPHSEMKLSAGEIRMAQTSLKKSGFYDGPIDGIAGPMTHQALRKYQLRNQLPVTGHFNDETVASLRDSDPATEQAGMKAHE